MIASPRKPSPPAGTLAPAEVELQGVFDPPSGLLARALAHNKLIVCVCALVFGLLGTAVGLHRQSVYTASSTLQVGQVNPNSPGFYSYVSSAAALATAFSRAVDAEPVLDAVQKQTHLTPAVAAGRLSAEPLPLSPSFRVIATGPTAAAAMELANTTSTALISYESTSNSANPEAASLLSEYHAASLHLERTTGALENLARAGGAKSPANGQALAAARADRVTAAAKLAALGAAYTSAVASQAPRSGLVSLVAGATSATTDKHAKVETLGVMGLFVGALIGGVLALARERRRTRRGVAEMREPNAG